MEIIRHTETCKIERKLRDKESEKCDRSREPMKDAKKSLFKLGREEWEGRRGKGYYQKVKNFT